MLKLRLLIAISISCAILIFSGCVKKVYIPDPDCSYSIQIRDARIQQLMQELNHKDMMLHDCYEALKQNE